MWKWFNQTSTRTALGTLLTTAASIATGAVNPASAAVTLLPILYGLVVNDKAPTQG